MNLINATLRMKDNRNEMDKKQISNEPGKPVKENDDINLRFALAIEELTSEDFLFDDEKDE
jgi:hypothetical protein